MKDIINQPKYKWKHPFKEKKSSEFKCDECDNTEEAKEFPYKKGWFYLYEFKVKNDKNVQISIRDKKFCSKKCLNNFVMEII